MCKRNCSDNADTGSARTLLPREAVTLRNGIVLSTCFNTSNTKSPPLFVSAIILSAPCFLYKSTALRAQASGVPRIVPSSRM